MHKCLAARLILGSRLGDDELIKDVAHTLHRLQPTQFSQSVAAVLAMDLPHATLNISNIFNQSAFD